VAAKGRRPGATADERNLAAAIAMRPLSPADEAVVRRGFQYLGRESRRMRYGLPATDAGRALAWVRLLGAGRDFAIGACSADIGDPVGVARWVRRPPGAEVAVTVVDGWQGHGVGTLLLETLLGYARAHEIGTLTAWVLSDNKRALRLARRFGVRRRSSPGDGLIEYEIAVAEGLVQHRISR
jgi:GNAT superfamily N-acetyltransferase